MQEENIVDHLDWESFTYTRSEPMNDTSNHQAIEGSRLGGPCQSRNELFEI